MVCLRFSYSKLVVLLCALSSVAWAALPQFTGQKRVGLTTGDQWEPAVAADGSGRIYVLYPHYGRVPGCKDCRVPTVLLVSSSDTVGDRKSTRLNSSHITISYAVFCLKKK